MQRGSSRNIQPHTMPLCLRAEMPFSDNNRPCPSHQGPQSTGYLGAAPINHLSGRGSSFPPVPSSDSMRYTLCGSALRRHTCAHWYTPTTSRTHLIMSRPHCVEGRQVITTLREATLFHQLEVSLPATHIPADLPPVHHLFIACISTVAKPTGHLLFLLLPYYSHQPTSGAT